VDTNRPTLARTSLLAAGAVSAGVHAGLVPEHLHEWLPLGVALLAAAAAGSAAVAALVLAPASPWPPRLLAVLLGGLLVSYALTRLMALPPLDPDRESLDAVGICTCAVEVEGVALALGLGRMHARLSLIATSGGTA
jgi:hypothetical protein